MNIMPKDNGRFFLRGISFGFLALDTFIFLYILLVGEIQKNNNLEAILGFLGVNLFFFVWSLPQQKRVVFLTISTFLLIILAMVFPSLRGFVTLSAFILETIVFFPDP